MTVKTKENSINRRKVSRRENGGEGAKVEKKGDWKGRGGKKGKRRKKWRIKEEGEEENESKWGHCRKSSLTEIEAEARAVSQL